MILEVLRCRDVFIGYKLYREVFGLDEVNKVKLNVNIFNLMMVSFYREGEIEMVERIWREMEEEVGCFFNVYSFSVLMEMYCF